MVLIGTNNINGWEIRKKPKGAVYHQQAVIHSLGETDGLRFRCLNWLIFAVVKIHYTYKKDMLTFKIF
jgi:hypothetical protein